MGSIQSIFQGLKDSVKNLICILIIFAIGVGLGYFLEYKNMNPKLEQANNTIKLYEAKFLAVDSENEKLLIENANLKNREPEKVYIKGETETKYVYVQKESADDPDVNVQAKPMEIKLSYNGQIMDLPMKDSSTSNIQDGTLFIGHQATGVLDVTSIVNREISKTILEKDLEIDGLKYRIRVLEREKIQNAFWGTVGGLCVGGAFKK